MPPVTSQSTLLPNSPRRRSVNELWSKEDWWAVWLGLGIILVAWLLFGQGLDLRWLAVAPPKWSTAGQLGIHFATAWPRYLAQFGFWLALFGVGTIAMGRSFREFALPFALLYAGAVLVVSIGAWDQAQRYGTEAPLVALLLGLILANVVPLPRALDAGFRVEFFIKTGIVLLGATLPFSLIVWAGPVAILQASIASVITFMVIFWVGKALGLDRRLAATLGVGGAVCGVSAAIAIAGAVRAKREHPPIAITLVVLWAVVMIFALPLVSRYLQLPAGVAGAWIGTSEFADAAGFAAAQAYGGLVGPETGITGTPDQAVISYTLVKVVGRDVWIGIWALVLSVIAITRWDAAETGGRIDVGQVWGRFPKFVLGFLLASLVITLAARGISMADYDRVIKPVLVGPISTLRSWAFVLSFLSIGLTTRVRELAPAGGRPFVAFTAGVIVNIALGYVLSVHVFGAHWEALGR